MDGLRCSARITLAARRSILTLTRQDEPQKDEAQIQWRAEPPRVAISFSLAPAVDKGVAHAGAETGPVLIGAHQRIVDEVISLGIAAGQRTRIAEHRRRLRDHPRCLLALSSSSPIYAADSRLNPAVREMRSENR